MDIQQLVSKYLQIHPDEATDLRLLSEQLEHTGDILSRKNFVGHVTASAFVINEHTQQVLLLENTALSKLLQPGGHVEKGDMSLLNAAHSSSYLPPLQPSISVQDQDLRIIKTLIFC